MKRGYFILLFVLLSFLLLYSEPLNAGTLSKITGNVIDSELREVCSNNLDDEGSYDLCQTVGGECHTVTGESGKYDCSDQLCRISWMALAGANDPCPFESQCSDGADNDEDGYADCADHDCDYDSACSGGLPQEENPPEPSTSEDLCCKDGNVYLCDNGVITNPYAVVICNNGSCVESSSGGGAYCASGGQTSGLSCSRKSSSSSGGGGCARRSSGGEPPEPDEICDLTSNPDAFSPLVAQQVPSDLRYPTNKPTGWNFDLSGLDVSSDSVTGSLALITYTLTSPGVVSENRLTFTESDSNGNCKFYYLPYSRPEQEITYELPFAYREGTWCYYDLSQVYTDEAALRGETLDTSILKSAKPLFRHKINIVTGVEHPDAFVKYEEIKSNTECSANYKETIEFTDNSGNTLRHCVKTVDEFVLGGEYVTSSYLEVFDSVQRCRSGGDGLVWFNDKNGNVVYLCVERKVASSEEEVVNDVLLIENSCPSGFVQSSDPIELEEKTIVHCIKNTVQQSPPENGQIPSCSDYS